jgi:hypothetical protein
MARSKRAAAEAAAEIPQTPAAPAINLPPTKGGLVIGITPDGQLYHQIFGEAGMVEVEGMMMYMRQTMDRRWDLVLPTPNEMAAAPAGAAPPAAPLAPAVAAG